MDIEDEIKEYVQILFDELHKVSCNRLDKIHAEKKFSQSDLVNVVANAFGYFIASYATSIGMHVDGSLESKIHMRDKFIKQVTEITIHIANDVKHKMIN